MSNNKGFTLTEVLLAVMIVGLVGVALAALTGTAVRESNVGRTRMMLRNQASIALRQLRQDVHQSSAVTCSNVEWTLDQGKKVDPNLTNSTITYSSKNNGTITRNGEDWINNVKNPSDRPVCQLVYSGAGYNSVMKITLVLGVDSEPPVTEYIEEIFMLPHGVAIKGEE